MTQVIAEIGWNHGGDRGLISEMVRAAAENGADFAKFQTWKTSRLKSGPWDSDGRREIYEKAELTTDLHLFAIEKCKEHGIDFLTSVFCRDDVDFIAEHCRKVKIPSPEAENRDLISECVEKFETVFLSTGAVNLERVMRWSSFPNVYLLHCVSMYPCPPGKVNMARMQSISSVTDNYGYSGHAPGINDAILAISLGAKVVEKHFTTDQSLPGRDNKFAILPSDLKRIRSWSDERSQMLQGMGTDYQPEEQEVRDVYSGRWG